MDQLVAVELGLLDAIVPPCYITVTWLSRVWEHERAVDSLTAVVIAQYPVLLGRLFRNAAGRWRVEGPPRENVSVERTQPEPLCLAELVDVPFATWPPHNLLPFLNALTLTIAYAVALLVLAVQGTVASRQQSTVLSGPD